jgi:lambda family phage portal protein
MAKTPPPTLNLIERIGAEISPKWALRRLQAKQVLALSGGYSGASRNRAALREWTPPASDAVTDLNLDLQDLRARSRDLSRNSMLGAGAIKTTVSHSVGTGLSYQSRIDATRLGLTPEQASAWQDDTEARFRLWCESPNCDITRTQNFYGLQKMALQSVCESGDILALMVNVSLPDWPFDLALQFVEADRLCNPDFKADTDTLIEGIEFGANSAPAWYNVARHHPGSVRRRAQQSWQRVPAFGARSGRRLALHIFDRTRPGQVRGVPMLAPVIEALKQLSRYTEAELQAAVVNAVFSVFMKMDPAAFGDLFDDDSASAYTKSAAEWNGSLNSAGVDNGGKVVNLLPGEEPVTVTPGRPNPAFEQFFQAISAQIGAALEIPFEVLIKHFSSSYSASRGAMLDAWRFFMGRRDFLATELCQPVVEQWLDMEVSAGRIAAPGYFADPLIRKAWCGSEWVGDGPGSIDPLKEVKAARERVEFGTSTIAAESILHDGKDWEQKHRQRTREVAARRAAGLEAELKDPNAGTPEPAEPDDTTD